MKRKLSPVKFVCYQNWQFFTHQNIINNPNNRSDGLRSLIRSFPDIPDKIEKTLRYPGHIDKIKLLKELGLFSRETLEVNGVKIKPIDLTKKLLFPKWKLLEGEEDFTVMQIIIKGMRHGKKVMYRYDMLDRYDRNSNTLSMARTTGYTCSIVTRLVARGVYSKKGISPPK